jgi:hypothetical protein
MKLFNRRPNLFTLALAIFWLIYTFILVYGMLQVSRFTPVEGTLVSAYASYRNISPTSRSPSWVLDVLYTYRFNGVAYEGAALRMGGNGMMTNSLAANKAAEMMAANKNITVWVNPSRPNDAIIDRGVSFQAWLFWGVLLSLVWLSHYFSPRITSLNPVLWKSKSTGDIDSSVDVLKRVDSYLAYGRTEQAIAVLEGVLKANPERQDLVLKLKRIKAQSPK